jgi:hypothetical protein
MKEPVIYYKEPGKHLEISVLPVPDWEGFEKLAAFAENFHSAKVIEKNDGPGSRKWILEKMGCKFELIHDEGYGNYFLARTELAERIIQEIGKDLENRFKNIKN